jgi:hypothetical protein
MAKNIFRSPLHEDRRDVMKVQQILGWSVGPRYAGSCVMRMTLVMNVDHMLEY